MLSARRHWLGRDASRQFQAGDSLSTAVPEKIAHAWKEVLPPPHGALPPPEKSLTRKRRFLPPRKKSCMNPKKSCPLSWRVLPPPKKSLTRKHRFLPPRKKSRTKPKTSCPPSATSCPRRKTRAPGSAASYPRAKAVAPAYKGLALTAADVVVAAENNPGRYRPAYPRARSRSKRSPAATNVSSRLAK